ncbi:translocation/assembly module TamB domain-containing protein [Guyparkeria hydrothermalis]|uniref:translocation/assembly module TamB domain-containing protein n=1 Tax=Guyparkeria hydrothermalis TaxID=923 RepID=UPI002021F3A4|nr:translocation/assembly module TamB domain-containing protein [Guyparkeria hydrothermalis]MCL7744552.1 translocation/assembly module TamB domain-containing protein [Guyparkeria hydrothermalis]
MVWARRVVLVIGWSVVLATLLLLVGLWWLTSTPSGVQWGVAQAERHLGALTVDEVSGTPWRGMRVAGLSWTPEQGANLRFEAASLQVDPGELWRARLHIPKLSVDGAEVELPPAPEPNATDQPAGLPAIPPIAIDLEQFSANRVVVRQGEARYELVEARLSAGLEARDQSPQLSMRLQALDLRLPDSLRVNGRGEVAAGLAGEMPLTARLDLLVDHPRGWLSGPITADGSIRDGVTLTPRLAWIGTDGVPASVCGRMVLDTERLDLESLRVDSLGGHLDLRGEARWAPRWSFDLVGEARSLDPAWVEPSLPGTLDFDLDAHLEAADGWLPARGKVLLSGLTGRLAGETLDDVTLDLRAEQTRATAELSGSAAGGQLAFDGHLTPERTFAAEWQIDALPIAGGDEKHGAMRLASRGRLDGQLPDWRRKLTIDDWIESSRVDLQGGVLRVSEHRDGQVARSAEARLIGRLDGGRLSVGQLALDAPGGELAASGDLMLSSDWARWRIEALEAGLSIPDLADLPWDLVDRLPGVDLAALRPQTARGKINMDVEAAGPLVAPHGRLDLDARGLQLAGYRLERAQTVVRLDPPSDEAPADRPAQLSLEAVGLRSTAGGPPIFDRLAVELAGRRTDHRWMIDIEGAADAHIEANGGWREGAWRGQLARLTLESPWAGGWRLPAAADMLLSPSAQRIDGLCLKSTVSTADGSVCLDAERQDGRTQASIKGDLGLQTLWAQWRGDAPANVTWAGRMRLDAEADLGPDGRMADLSLVLPASELRIDNAGGESDEPEAVTYPETRLTARLADERVKAALSGGVEDWLMVDGQGTIGLADRSLDGNVSLRQADLARLFTLADRLVGPIQTPVSDVTGTLGGEMTLSGRLDAPQLAGRLTGRGLGFSSLPTGTSYRDGRVELRIDEAGQLELTGSLLGEADTPPKPVFEGRHVTETAMPASRGRIQLDGSGHLRALDDWRFSATLGGEAIPLLRLPSLALDARPDLEGEFTPSGGRLSGSIHVPLAIANVARLPENARRNSEDLVIVGKEPEPRKAGYPLTGDINVVLGDSVSLRGQGLATRLTGGMEMRLRPEQPVGAFGEIRLVDGRYEAYGQTLMVERGRLTFAGPLTSPGLDVVATRKIEDEQGTVVGLQIVGPLESPETEVFSRPPTSPSNALSLLLTGRELSAGSDADASLLLNAIAGLGIRQGDQMAQQVRSVFGIDEIGFTTSGGAEGARLSVGKRIGENLLVRYAVGVFDGVGEVITRYRINKFLHLELSSSAQSQSGDLIYQIDRGRPED